jgi:hypothetical protein
MPVPTMPDWILNPQACYVFAAYGVAAAGLLGLLLFSWRDWCKRKAEWQQMKNQRHG